MGEFADMAVGDALDIEFYDDRDLFDLYYEDTPDYIPAPRNAWLAITELKYETEKAWLVTLPEYNGPMWFPKSYCLLDMGEMKINVPRWLMERKGITGAKRA